MNASHDLTGIVRDAMSHPRGNAYRSLIVDYLEDHHDPRLELFTLVDRLLETPKTLRLGYEGYMPEEFPFYGNSRKSKCPLGRLFLLTMIEDLIADSEYYGVSRYAYGPQGMVPEEYYSWVLRCKLYSSRLINLPELETFPSGVRIRQTDGLAILLKGFPWVLVSLLFHCRNGRNGCYSALAEIILTGIVRRYQCHPNDDVFRKQAWGRWLSMHDAFIEIYPWEALERIYQIEKGENAYKRRRVESEESS